MRMILCVFVAIVVQYQVFAQIDTTQNVRYLVEEILLGSGVLAGNVSFQGEKHAIGLYQDSTNQLGIISGIVLTSGNAYYVMGPNKTPRSGWASNAPGDPELDKIARGKTYDASVLEFDFVTSSENVAFEFVFGSEEYLEYVGSKFNDVFAFFITSSDGKKINIAKLPDGITPITVNTVNHKMNSEYYVDNAYINTTDPFVWDVRNRKVITNEHYLQAERPPLYFTQFDGFTRVLEAKASVRPNHVYHIKIAIADVGDGILDSGVFLKAGSFHSYGEQVVALDDHFKNNEEHQRPLPLVGKSISNQSQTEVKLQPNLKQGIIEFEFDRYELSPHAQDYIRKVFANWSLVPNSKIEVKGHTDNFGSAEYNNHLSKNRAEAVALALEVLGVPREQLIISFYGEKKPIQPNNSDSGRARNRRVEVSIMN